MIENYCRCGEAALYLITWPQCSQCDQTTRASCAVHLESDVATELWHNNKVEIRPANTQRALDRARA